MIYRFAIAVFFLVALNPPQAWGQKDSESPATNTLEDAELTAIKSTLDDYIQGSTNGQPDRLKKAFHPDLNLYSVRQSRLQVWSGKDYIADTKPGKPTGETGEIVAIDYEHDIAVAKVKISPPNGPSYVDYFMMLKAEQKWTIVHKMYTRKNARSGSAGRWGTELKPDAIEKPDSAPTKNKTSSSVQLPTSIDGSSREVELPNELDLVAEKCLREQHLPGLAIVVVKDGKTILKRGYGLASIEKKTPVDPDRTLFRIGSISKALTFLTLTRLIDERRIKRTDSVEKYIGPIANPYNFSSPVTIDHLLTHTSGFDQIGTGRHIFQHDLSVKERKALRPGIVEFLNDNNLRRVTAPGELYRYDTYGTTLAGAIIAKVTGKSFADAMKDEMFDTLGMHQTHVEATDEMMPQLAIGYGWENNAYQPQPYEVYVTTPASSIDGTIADMGRLLEALTSDGANGNGRLFSPSMHQKVLEPQFRAHPEFLGITHGLFESFTSDEAEIETHFRTVGHGGSMRGFRSAMTVIPDENIGIFITANRAPEAGGGDVNFTPFLKVVLESIAESPKRKPFLIPNNVTVDLDTYTGDYYYGTYCHSITPNDLSKNAWRRGRPRTVKKHDNGLQIDDEDFVPRGKDVFVQNDGQRMVVFSRKSNGEISSFTYSTSPDTFERASTSIPYPEIRSLAQATYEVVNSEGHVEAARFFLQNENSENFYVNEDEMNRVGYILLQSDQDQAALEMFKLNARRFPESWNVFDSLGDAYAKLNNVKLAVLNFEKSVTLNPNNLAGKAKAIELLKAR